VVRKPELSDQLVAVVGHPLKLVQHDRARIVRNRVENGQESFCPSRRHPCYRRSLGSILRVQLPIELSYEAAELFLARPIFQALEQEVLLALQRLANESRLANPAPAVNRAY
jgi:hypothetical protein